MLTYNNKRINENYSREAYNLGLMTTADVDSSGQCVLKHDYFVIDLHKDPNCIGVHLDESRWFRGIYKRHIQIFEIFGHKTYCIIRPNIAKLLTKEELFKISVWQHYCNYSRMHAAEIFDGEEKLYSPLEIMTRLNCVFDEHKADKPSIANVCERFGWNLVNSQMGAKKYKTLTSSCTSFINAHSCDRVVIGKYKLSLPTVTNVMIETNKYQHVDIIEYLSNLYILYQQQHENKPNTLEKSVVNTDTQPE
jgi:hypothetical protein